MVAEKRSKMHEKWSLSCAVLMLFVSLLLLQATVAFQPQPAFTRQGTSSYASSENGDSKPPPKKKKKTMKGFTINPNLVGSISSDGILTDRRQDQPARAASTSLGVPSRRKKKQKISSTKKPLSKKERQRTANGAVDSSLQTLIADPANENVQVLEAKRGTKTVTIVR